MKLTPLDYRLQHEVNNYCQQTGFNWNGTNMPLETVIAQQTLLQAIEHWEQNVKAESISKVDTTSQSCPLCGLYLRNGCIGCPVNKFTKHTHCDETPYKAAHLAYVAWMGASEHLTRYKEAFRVAAQAEVDFLKSLVEKEP
jgi:hypothetical protein